MPAFKSLMTSWVIGIILSVALAGNLDRASGSRLTSTSNMITQASEHKSSPAPTLKEDLVSKLSTSGAGAGDATSEESDTQVQGFFTHTRVEPQNALVYGGWKVTTQVGETINAHCTDTRNVNMDQPQFMPGNYITQNFPVSHQTLVWYCNFFWNTAPVDKDGSIIAWAFNGKSYLHSCDRDCEWEVRKEGFFLKNWSDGKFYHQADWRVHHPV